MGSLGWPDPLRRASGMIRGPAALLDHEWWSVAVCVVLGVALCVPAVGPCRAFDDVILERALRGPHLPGLADGIFGAFSFASGDPASNRALVERGVLLPWWSDAALRVAFLRPLSALTHALDFVCWPDAPRLMYLHSLAWLGLVIAAVTRLFRRLEPNGRVALLAGLFLAAEPAHGSAVGWLSSRNTLIATFFGVCAIFAWVGSSRALAACLFAVALLSGEVALGALAYIGCHAWLLDSRPARERMRSLLPFVLVTVTWRTVYVGLGFGARGSGAYVDPLADFAAWVRLAPERVVTSLGAELGPLPADLAFAGRPEHARWLSALACLAVLAFGFAIVRELRADPVARYWAAGALLAAVPLAAAPPNDRGLLFVALGVSPLVARLAAGIRGSVTTKTRSRRGRAALAVAFVGSHALVAPVMLAARAAQFQVFGRALARAGEVLDTLADLPHRTLVVLNPPLDMLASYVEAERAVRGAPLAAHFYWLASATSPLTITRVSADALELTREGGLFSTPLERLYRRDPASLKAGTRIELDAMDAEIVASSADGTPLRAEFRFRAPLEDESLVFLVWRSGKYERVSAPARGRTVTYEPEDLVSLVFDRGGGL